MKLAIFSLAFLCASILQSVDAFAIPVGFIFPATQVCDGNGNTIGCSFGGNDCGIIVVVDIPVGYQVNSPSGGVSVNSTTETSIGTDLYKANATSSGLPSGYQNLQGVVYSHTGRVVLSDALSYYSGYQLYGN